MGTTTIDRPAAARAGTQAEPTVRPPRPAALAHIPGGRGWPLVGETFEALADPKAFFERRAARHGLVFRTNLFGEMGVSLLGPEANALFLLDPDRNFSSHLGWDRFLGRVFPRGLMLMDFDEHRVNRRALSVAFKAGPMRSYLAALDAGIGARVAQWRTRPGALRLYPAMKQLTFDLAATSFLGADDDPDLPRVLAAFVAMVAASVAPIRAPLPGTQMGRGVRGRGVVVDWFSRQVPLRRERGGDDLFSQLCRATTDDGALLSTQAVVDHMSFMIMAAHDTLTSSLSAFVAMLAGNPDWQARLREEVAALDLAADAPLPFETLDAMPLTELAFKESLRIIPPVVSPARRALRDFEFAGFRIPGGTPVGPNILFSHHMPEIWPEPDRFDPMRFTDAAQKGRHRFAYAPYGGGAHMCLGLHYANMQAKVFARHFLSRLTVTPPPGPPEPWRMWPIPAPKRGLLLTVSPA